MYFGEVPISNQQFKFPIDHTMHTDDDNECHGRCCKRGCNTRQPNLLIVSLG